MTLSEDDIKIIEAHPLNDLLAIFRNRFREVDNAGNPPRADVTALIGVLVISPAAYVLPSPNGREYVADTLFSIRRNELGRDHLTPDQLKPLVDAVVNNSSDTVIWEAVFNLINTLEPTTPPQSSLIPTIRGTPVKSSSSRLADSENAEIVEAELFHELKDCVFRDVGGFLDKFFNPRHWSDEQKAMLKHILEKHDNGRWSSFPSVPDEGPVWDWLCSLEGHALTGAPHTLHSTKTAYQFKERKGQMDIFFQSHTATPRSVFEYKQVLVAGEHKRTYAKNRFKADFLQLARHIRGVFADQPTRRFVHGFTLCGFKMELWIFDRSGAYSSGVFNIHEKPDMLARALVGYATMDDNAMGLDLFIERCGKADVESQEPRILDVHTRRYLTLEDANGNSTRIKLSRQIVRQKAVVCRGTTCYASRDEHEPRNTHVTKFSWASAKRDLEIRQLRLAAERGVEGVARLVAHHQITTIAELRDGLKFGDRHAFRNDDFDDGPLLLKRPFSEYSSDTSESSKAPSGSQRSGSQKPKLAQELAKSRPSLYSRSDDLWDNRIYSCLVISPAGRIISDFRTVRELLEAMRDAIRAHRSLYITGNILHRDISSNNIIITWPNMSDGFRGMLIDLDLAKVKDSGPSGARHQTGTMQFMAVEVLQAADHTYRHDLESFFYVLLWMCARQSWSNGFSGSRKRPKETCLRTWELGTFKAIAAAKKGHMTINGLEDDLLPEFPDTFEVVKPLCFKIRSILFGDTARLRLGTPVGDPDELYGPIIRAFDQTISEL